MIKKVDLSYYLVLGVASLDILMGIGAYYYPIMLLLPVVGAVDIYLVTKRRRAFIEDYSKYHCDQDGGIEIPDKFVKFLYYGKGHLFYMTGILTCNIIPYDGLEVESVTDRAVTIVNKMYLKKIKVDISQVRIPDFDKLILKNIEEAKNMDIHSADLKREIEEREAKQKALAPTALLFILLIDTFSVLILAALLLLLVIKLLLAYYL